MTRYTGTNGDDDVTLDVYDEAGDDYAFGQLGDDKGVFFVKDSSTDLITAAPGEGRFLSNGFGYFRYTSFEDVTLRLGISDVQVQVWADQWFGSSQSLHIDSGVAVGSPGGTDAPTDGNLLTILGGVKAIRVSLLGGGASPGDGVVGPLGIEDTSVTFDVGTFQRLQISHESWDSNPAVRDPINSADDHIVGGDRNDVLGLGGGQNYAAGNGGDDRISSFPIRGTWSGQNWIPVAGSEDWKNEFWGGDGNDTLIAGGINDRIDGGDGFDIWDGDFGFAYPQTFQQNSTAVFSITQTTGTTLETSGTGKITGIERAVINAPYYTARNDASFTTGIASIDYTGSSSDLRDHLTIDWSTKSAAITATLFDEGPTNIPTQYSGTITDGTETITFKWIEFPKLLLGSGDDRVDASAANLPYQGWQAMEVDGGAGDDVLIGGPRLVTLYGGEGDDTLSGRGELHSGDGNDRLTGGWFLDAGAGDDRLTIDDTLPEVYGGTALGGEGTDTLRLPGNLGDYTITAVEAGTSYYSFDPAWADPSDGYVIHLVYKQGQADERTYDINAIERLIFDDGTYLIGEKTTTEFDERAQIWLYSVELVPVLSNPTGTDATLAVEQNAPHVFTAADFGFVDPQGDALSAIIIDVVPQTGSLTLDGAAVTAGERIDAADIAAGLLRYAAPLDADGNVMVGIAIDSMTFRVADEAGDTSETANTLSIDVGVTHVTGTDGDDVISWVNAPPGQPFTAQYGPNYVDALGGNDSILTGDGNDIVFGGDGDDVIQTLGGDDIVYGGTGDDTIIAGFGNDLYDGGDGYDTVDFFGYFSDLSFDYDPSGTVTMAGPETGSQTLVGIERLYSSYTGASYIRDAATGEFVLEYAPPPVSPVIGRAGTQTASSSGSDTLTGTAAAETFVIDGGASGTTGADSITGFGTNDVVVVTEKFVDRNEDGIITFGRNRKFDFDGPDTGTDSVAINGGAAKALRYLGEATDRYYTYALASVRPKHAKEGYIYSDDTLSGGATDNKRDIFFADTALGIDLGHDVFANFGARDLLVTTTALADPDGDGTVALSGGLDLADGGSIAVTGMGGASVDALTLSATVTRAGVTYYLYGLPGSSHSAGELTF